MSTDIDSIFRSTCEPHATDAQRAIDKEIAGYDAAIRVLKTQRNTHSSISRLPPEIFAAIFQLVRSGQAQTAPVPSWINVTSVCRQWRAIALASPQMWTTIDISHPGSALELLKRSKSAPLQISCGTHPYDVGLHTLVAGAVMAEIGRMQTLQIWSMVDTDVLQFLPLPGVPGATILEDLQLSANTTVSQPPPNVLLSGMPSISRLSLVNIPISLEISPLPHLTYLRLSFTTGGIQTSLLLSYLQHSPNLKEIDISGVVKDTFLPSRVQLPNLLHISISSDILDVSAIFANLDYPSSVSVKFALTEEPAGEPDWSHLATLCARFAEPDAPTISKVLAHGWRFSDAFEFTVESVGSEKLSLVVALESGRYPEACLALCSGLPLEIVPVLEVGCLQDMRAPQWADLFRRFERIRCLHLSDVSTLPFSVLTELSLEKPHFSALQTLQLSACDLDREGSSAILGVLKDLLEQRKRHELPIKDVALQRCFITKGELEELKAITQVDWDGRARRERRRRSKLHLYRHAFLKPIDQLRTFMLVARR
ncbi:hypothetical protein PC9H_002090 [Pleurotus ostreatus]|uniref:F-box domain-containing protein n=1 Tax=Pleurotus ostreatus TaxID=5322 RepID=A0A8H6ZKP1_PLEOS|nr:uncharacterized protein PC9H_002090 [Pleurotus ostreatus]KAF7419499.1 hypothetical protein PC9H_002090 [Pleurotus ostreatus]